MASLGFTGPRTRMTPAQQRRLCWIFEGVRQRSRTRPTLRIGLCTGCDDTAARLARCYGFWIVGHPGVSGRDGTAPYRSDFACDVTLPERPYLARDEDIVDLSEALIATPRTAERTPGRASGTWWTIDYAWRAGKVCYLIILDGRILVRDPRRATIRPTTAKELPHAHPGHP